MTVETNPHPETGPTRQARQEKTLEGPLLSHVEGKCLIWTGARHERGYGRVRFHGRILGAHLLGPGTEELINLFTMAMRAELKAGEVQELIFGYPTFASDMGYMV